MNNPRHWVWSSQAQNILYHWCNLNPASEVCEAELVSLFIYFYFILNNIYSGVPSLARLVLMGPCCSRTTMDTMNYRPDWLIRQSLLYRLIIAHMINSNPDTQLGTQNKNFGAQTCRQTWCTVQFYLLPSPPPTPQQPPGQVQPFRPGSRNCLKRSCPGGRGWGK